MCELTLYSDFLGSVRTIAGTGAAGFFDGPCYTAKFSNPRGIAVDRRGNILVADYGNNKVRAISSSGIVL